MVASHHSPPVPAGVTPIGYAQLVRELGLTVMPPHRWSYIGGSARRSVEDGVELVVHPPGYDVGDRDSVVQQMLFSLRHDGLSLEILDAVFRRLDAAAVEPELAAAVRAKPTGKHLRRLWYAYELLSGRRLDLPDLARGNYVPLLDPARYYTGPSTRARRQRVHHNLLGNALLSPTVRRTATLAAFDASSLGARVQGLVDACDPALLSSAISFLYTKESRSSFALESERLPRDRTERFIALLRALPEPRRLTREALVRLHAAVVDPRFAEHDYRSTQVYVGETIDQVRQHIHFIAPRPEDVPELMEGLLRAIEGCASRDADVDPVVLAAALSFAFVLIHPFEDGNGRLHRLLIHYLLARAGVGPRGLVIPVSAVMLARRAEYDACLESFSRPLMERLDYQVDEEGGVTVRGETAGLYRYFDATRMAEDLVRWLTAAVHHDLPEELDFLAAFHRARVAVREVVDLPDRLLTLFVKVCEANGGVLSARKRAAHFDMLDDDEVARMEEAVRAAFGVPAAGA